MEGEKKSEFLFEMTLVCISKMICPRFEREQSHTLAKLDFDRVDVKIQVSNSFVNRLIHDLQQVLAQHRFEQYEFA